MRKAGKVERGRGLFGRAAAGRLKTRARRRRGSSEEKRKSGMFF